MAQRSDRRFSSMVLLHLTVQETEKQKPIPARARHLMRNGTERTKGLAFVREPLLKHNDHDPLALIRALQNRSDRRQASISSRLRRAICVHEFIPKTAWSPQPQV